MKTPDEFAKFIREDHIKDCLQCKEDGGENALKDYNYYAYNLYKRFYEASL